MEKATVTATMSRVKPLPARLKATLDSLRAGSTQSGSVARYSQLDEQTGVKLYRWKKVRDMCYLRQERAYGHGFAPRCWQPFRHRMWGILWHGFYTEHVTIADDLRNDGVIGYGDCHTAADELREKMDLLFDGMFDLSGENFGKLPNGKWVVLDFSHLEDENGEINEVRPQWRSSNCMERYKTIY
jgi:hypothetical protein